jgi:Ferritin-like domain
MEIDRDFVRREAREIDAAHRAAMKQDQATLDRLMNDADARPSADTERADSLATNRLGDLVLGGFNRRQLLMFGGAAVATSAVFAACKGAVPSVQVVPPTTASTALQGTAKDVTILRTASSIEALAVSVYASAISSGLVKTTTTLDLIKLFQTHHSQHGDLFQRSTKAAGGSAFTAANPVLLQQLVQPRLAALKTEADVVSLAFDLEHLASATYQGDVGMFDNAKFNSTVASVGAAEARHVALLAVLSAKSATGTPDNAFQLDLDAVNPGTGV